MTGPRKSIINSSDAGPVDTGVPELNEAGFDISDVQVIPVHKMKSKAAEAKFMEEIVIVHIEADDEPNSPVFIKAGHNGVDQWIERGKDASIKRKYLYSLLAGKRVRLACAFGRDGQGNEFNRLTPSGQTTHRVHLIRDDNPQGGMRWFQSITAAA